MMPRGTRRGLAVVAIVQLLALIVFLYAGHRADTAMDKGGVGDMAAFERWSVVGGIAFWSYVLLWGVSTALATAGWLAERRVAEAQVATRAGRIAAYALLLPPAVFPLAFVLYLALG